MKKKKKTCSTYKPGLGFKSRNESLKNVIFSIFQNFLSKKKIWYFQESDITESKKWPRSNLNNGTIIENRWQSSNKNLCV